ncbi:U-box domain-containing protein 4-like [Silene latifolia]|uniref:U-box domain-containing protein 4-like n=1 Tax=Silene latifolia TaxID=37657 RepID=UPI003D77190D
MVSYSDLVPEQTGDSTQLLQNSETDDKMIKDRIPASTEITPHKDPVSLTTITDLRQNRKTRLKQLKPSPVIISAMVNDTRSGAETHVRKLTEDLKSESPEIIREAAFELRLLAKDEGNRILIPSCGAITVLVDLLFSPDLIIQENAVTAILNLSISDNNKLMIANSGAIEALVHVLRTGTPGARENSAATLTSLTKFDDNKIRIGKSGAIGPLVDLLENGTLQGKKDAATALFNLSTATVNRSSIIESGAVKHLIGLMDPALGMVDRATVVLANLATVPEGRTAIAQAGGIPLLVEAIELGSPRGKENAAAALSHFCSDSNKYCRKVLDEGAGPPLVALSLSGTPRAKEKAIKTLSHLRNLQRVYGSRD